jgi:hypothetical protein
MAKGLISIPRDRLPAMRASTQLVPEPQNGSKTKSPFSEYLSIKNLGICGMSFAV